MYFKTLSKFSLNSRAPLRAEINGSWPSEILSAGEVYEAEKDVISDKFSNLVGLRSERIRKDHFLAVKRALHPVLWLTQWLIHWGIFSNFGFQYLFVDTSDTSISLSLYLSLNYQTSWGASRSLRKYLSEI